MQEDRYPIRVLPYSVLSIPPHDDCLIYLNLGANDHHLYSGLDFLKVVLAIAEGFSVSLADFVSLLVFQETLVAKITLPHFPCLLPPQLKLHDLQAGIDLLVY
jgi:hypothetical protein